MKSILDKDFRYTPSTHTDIKATFRRVKKEMAKEETERKAAAAEVEAKVRTIRRRTV